jgi:DnaJ-class molecular chaperone
MFLKIVEAYEVLSDINSRKKYDLTLQNDFSQTSSAINGEWIPSADLSRFYSYDMIKNWNVPKSGGGIWDIGEKENRGMWKTTLALFGCLATLAIFIIILSG